MKVNENMRSETIEPNQYERSAVDFEIAKFDIQSIARREVPRTPVNYLHLDSDKSGWRSSLLVGQAEG